jgi:carbon-monoxide dehydrogenase medium subunit
MMALGAQVAAVGPKGERTIGIDEFFLDALTTALKPNEILTEIRIPIPPAKSGGAYEKLERKVGDFATAAAAAQLTLGPDGKVAKVGIALTNAGPTPIRAAEAEAFLKGKTPDAAALAEAGKLAAKAAKPSADRRGAEDYKKEMARVLVTRALRRAVQRAGGKA